MLKTFLLSNTVSNCNSAKGELHMKKVLISLFLFFTFSLNTLAQHIPSTILEGYTGYVRSIVFSPDGRRLASDSRDSRGTTIHLWDGVSGEHIATLEGHTDHSYLISIVFSPDGRRLASGSADTPIRLWDGVSGEHIATLETAYSFLFSPDGRRLASSEYEGSTILLWDGVSGEPIATLEGHTDDVNSIVFSPDGRILASGSDDRTILWKISDTHISLTPIPVMSPAIGEQFSISVSIVAGENVGGYQMSLVFDPSALRYVESANGDYLPSGALFVPPVVSSVVKEHNGDYRPSSEREDVEVNAVTLGATSLTGISEGDGTLATVTFEVLEVKESVIQLFDTILTDSDGEHLPQWHSSTKVVKPSLLPSAAIVSLTPSSLLSPAIGEQLTFNFEITGGKNVKDFAFTPDYDPSALKYISTRRGDYLTNGVGNGDGRLATATFEVLAVKASTVSFSGYLIGTNGLLYLPTFENAKVIVPIFGDVNRDGVVNILDLVQVASKFGQSVSGDPADVNEDGVVNIVDLVKVAGALGGGAAAPSVLYSDLETTPTRADVQNWLSQAQQLNLTDAISQRGILFLEQLLEALTPKETALLPNYPNPFNPETWIPYQLATPADVNISIYAADGRLVRRLDLGHRSVGTYESRSRAAYWDGRNAQGEPVASGIYFYTLTAGEFTATRKMSITK